MTITALYWNKTSTSLPTSCDPVLVKYGGDNFCVAEYDTSGVWLTWQESSGYYIEIEKVTHWTDLPKLD